MPIEFRCPNCGRLLRTPDDAVGRQAQCPGCGGLATVPAAGQQAAFTPPPPGTGSAAGDTSPFATPPPSENPYQSPAPPGSPGASGSPFSLDVAAAQRLSGPAIGLMIMSGLSLLMAVLGLLGNITHVVLVPNANRADVLPVFLMGGLGITINAITVVFGLVILLGAIKMKNLENYRLAYVAAILASIPCFSACCLIQMPLGIWALTVLSDPAVKAAFRD